MLSLLGYCVTQDQTNYHISPGALIHREGTTVIHRYGVDLATVSAVGGASCVSTATASSLSLGTCLSSSTPIPREKRFHF